MTNVDKVDQRLNGLQSGAGKVYQVMAEGETLPRHKIRAALSSRGVTPKAPTFDKWLGDLVRSGLIVEPSPGHFRRVPQKPKLVAARRTATSTERAAIRCVTRSPRPLVAPRRRSPARALLH